MFEGRQAEANVIVISLIEFIQGVKCDILFLLEQTENFSREDFSNIVLPFWNEAPNQVSWV
jgi:hypothetical protein